MTQLLMCSAGSLTTVARGSCQRTIVGGTSLAVITGTELLGVVGNIAALCILRGQARNRRHALMLRCLAANDLVALLGMLVQLYLRQFLPCYLYSEFWFCVVRVLWRIFGLGSGCVAIVMAIERWLALTHPFFYQRVSPAYSQCERLVTLTQDAHFPLSNRGMLKLS